MHKSLKTNVWINTWTLQSLWCRWIQPGYLRPVEWVSWKRSRQKSMQGQYVGQWWHQMLCCLQAPSLEESTRWILCFSRIEGHFWRSFRNDSLVVTLWRNLSSNAASEGFWSYGKSQRTWCLLIIAFRIWSGRFQRHQFKWHLMSRWIYCDCSILSTSQ